MSVKLYKVSKIRKKIHWWPRPTQVNFMTDASSLGTIDFGIHVSCTLSGVLPYELNVWKFLLCNENDCTVKKQLWTYLCSMSTCKIAL